MKKLILFLTIVTGIVACGVCKPKPSPKPTEETIVHYKDSTVLHDSTIYCVIPKEVYNDYTALLDTLSLSTKFSEFSSWIDTTNNILKGKAKNKIEKLPVEIKWKERFVYKDSIQIKEVPIEVEKEIIKYPKSYWWFLGISILALIYIGIKIYLKFKI